MRPDKTPTTTNGPKQATSCQVRCFSLSFAQQNENKTHTKYKK